jgi:hypothetical protein
MKAKGASPRRSASTISAIVAFGSALGPVYLFHHNRGRIAIFISLAFSLLAAVIAYFIVERITRDRWTHATPVFGALRGAGAAVATYTLTLVAHVCVNLTEGPLWVGLLLTLAFGIVLFGWVVAIVGAMVGMYCEIICFPQPDANVHENPRH